MDIAAVDLFCGAGGLTNGLTASGIKVVAGVDADLACEFPYSANNNAQFILSDIRHLDAERVASWYPKRSLRLLAGCAPCQPFSSYTRNKEEDSRWSLLYHFIRIVESILPEFVTMENVTGLKKHPIFNHFCNRLEHLGYAVATREVSCQNFNIPQTRKRLVITASRFGLASIKDPEAENITVRHAIGHLPPIPAGGSDKVDSLHTSAGLSEINMHRIRSSKPGGTWRDWPNHLRARCHQRPSGKTYPSVYGRMSWDAPSPTITTQFHGYGNGRFGHPEQDRAISLREGAILQGFPANYQFASGSNLHLATIGRLIGNAVPPNLGKAIGESFLQQV